MPELPEAETIVRGLREPLEGRRIQSVRVIRPDVVEGPASRFMAGLAGRGVQQVGRRGKNVVIRLDDGSRLVVNLGMSGRLLYRPPGDPSPPPTHPVAEMPLVEGEGEAAGTLIYHDIRRFGLLRILPARDYRSWSDSLGPEPLDRGFTARYLAQACAASRSPIRSWLLDQQKVAGVGNIYANEAVHRAGIHPRTRALRIPDQRIPRLHRAIRRVLRDAIEARGTTLRDYRTAQGWEGSYAGALRVYGREGEPCPRCGTAVEREVFGNRSAFFCPRCQPVPTDEPRSDS
ncbi:MAG: bifunctional DNA-formamidopyrimidine glycosylase/DNA-(apurinic or apyrimidinic site) lyase [Gemmatimonadales bacterium]|nr:MAG: bifunctional DNA-formamidopyrimidine glycosylase/DNA-(apurinic or apyrimidinic site) lyase [Gemmatimonadales bacterium]